MQGKKVWLKQHCYGRYWVVASTRRVLLGHTRGRVRQRGGIGSDEAYNNLLKYGQTQREFSTGTESYPNGNTIKWISINGTTYYFREYGNHGPTFHNQLRNGKMIWKYRPLD